MLLRGHVHARRLVVRRLLGANGSKIPSATLNASTTRVFHRRFQGIPATYQWISFYHSYAAAPVDEGVQDYLELTPRIPPVKREIPIPVPGSHEGQAQGGSELGQASTTEQQERESYMNDAAALLRSILGALPQDESSGGVVCGKNKADKELVNQRLRDKGTSSHDWRIPLLSLEQNDQSQDGDAGLVRRITPRNRVREVLCKPNQRHVRLAREIARPAAWTEATLCQYVADVAKSQVLQKTIPRGFKIPQTTEWSNMNDITIIFNGIFYDTAMQKFLSVAAFDIALQFYYKYEMYSKARALFAQMMWLKFKISTSTFNILLRAAASNKDLHNFTFLLHRMLLCGLRPDEETWVNLLIAVDSREVRALIVQRMKERNIARSASTTKAIAALMIPNEVETHLRSGYDPDTFLKHMDSCYGTGWLTTGAGNSVLNEISKTMPVSDCIDLLTRMKQCSFVPDEVTLNTLLRKILPRRGYCDAIEILQFFDRCFRLSPGSETYEVLLRHAWSGKMLNLARVIWRSACIDGYVDFRTRQRVFRSLLSHGFQKDLSSPEADCTGVSRPSRGEIFGGIVGNFVVGLKDPPKAELAELGRALWASQIGSRTSTRKWAKLRLRSDESLAGGCRLKVPLPELLRRALELDRKWAAEGFWKDDNRQRFFKDGIRVEVDIPKKSLFEARRLQRDKYDLRPIQSP